MIINVLLTLHSYNEDCANEYIIKNNDNSWVAPARWEEAEDNRKISLITETFCPDCGKGLGRCSERESLHGDSRKLFPIIILQRYFYPCTRPEAHSDFLKVLEDET